LTNILQDFINKEDDNKKVSTNQSSDYAKLRMI